MARLLFVHDHQFVIGADGTVCTSGSLPRTVWSRYLRYFDALEVLARSREGVPLDARLATSQHPQVTFTFVPSLASIQRLLFRPPSVLTPMTDAIRRCDAVVARVPSELGFLAAALAHRMRKPSAVEVDGCAWDCYLNHGTVRGTIYAPLAYLRLRRTVRRAQLAAYVTSEWLQRRYPCRGLGVGVSDVEVARLEPAAARGRQHRLGE